MLVAGNVVVPAVTAVGQAVAATVEKAADAGGALAKGIGGTAKTVLDKMGGGHYDTTAMPGQIGNMAWSRRPTSDLFRAADGSLMFVVNSELHYALLFRTIDRPEVLEDPRFATWALRSQNVAALRAIIEEALATDTVANWERRLKAAGVAVAQVKNIGEALASPQLAHRNLLQTVPGPPGVDRPVTVMNAPFLCDEDGPGVERAAPGIGEHNAEVLAEAGYSPEEIAAFAREGAFWQAPARVRAPA